MAAKGPAAELVDAKIAKDRIDPGCEAGFVLEVRGVLDHPNECVLDDLFGNRLRSNVPEREVEESGLVPPDESSEGSPFAALEADHEDFVGRVAGAHGRTADFCIYDGTRRAS
jgi:hypothetical protein